MNLGRTKTIEQSIADTEERGHQLRRRLGPLDLTVFGVGVTIGTGIFVLTGKAAGIQAGPAVALSFVFAGIACALAALCYAEFASTVPVAGSAYTFSYATLGELVAWIIGWDLILELALGASTVAVGWSTYFADVAHAAGVTIPGWAYGNGHNLIAAAIVLLLTAVICLGIKVSARVNLVIVAVKLAVVLFVIVAGLFYIKAGNYSPFIPPAGSPGAAGATSTPSLLQDLGFAPGSFGISGIFTGAALVFFAFIGFDIVATAAEETRRPQRDLPIGILGSLAICTALYVAVSLVVTGMVKYTSIKVDAPLAAAFRSVGRPGYATVISIGALLGLTTVMMILLLGQSRVFFAMSRDRLLPPAFAQVNPRFGTPVRTTITTGIAVAPAVHLRPAHRARRAGQHRYPVRFRPGGHRRTGTAPDPPRPAPGLPLPGSTRGPGAGRAHLDVPDAEPARHHLAEVLHLDGSRPGRLLRLRRPPQPARRPDRADGTGRLTQDVRFRRLVHGRPC
jgi:basic amino acid/polyamine antiporter, APA family